MRPKGKLLALVAMFAAVGLITATGAFTTVEAERTATVDVAGDSAALLAINPADSMDEGAVTETDGVAQIDLTGSNLGSADGLNPDARTTLTPLVNITNNGNNEVDITVNVTGVDGTSAIDESDVTIVDESGSDIDDVTQSGITSGEGIEFGLIIDLTGVDQSQITDDNIDINIDITANESGS